MKAVFALLLVSLIAGIFFVEDVNANPGFVDAPAIYIVHPEPIGGKCYTSATVPLTIEVLLLDGRTKWDTDAPNIHSPNIVSISYSLDSGAKVTFVNFTEGDSNGVSPNGQVVKYLSVSSALNNLAEGKHTLKAYSLDVEGGVMSTETTFLVNTTYVSPKLSLISPQGNHTYVSNKIPLTFWVNWDIKSAYYYLDNEKAAALDSLYLFSPPVPGKSISGISINGNSTLSNLSEGKHEITLYVSSNDMYHKFPLMVGVPFFVNTTNTKGNLPLENQNPSVPELSWLIIVFLLAATVPFAIFKLFRKRK
jgi:hypothetical protein